MEYERLIQLMLKNRHKVSSADCVTVSLKTYYTNCLGFRFSLQENSTIEKHVFSL